MKGEQLEHNFSTERNAIHNIVNDEMRLFFESLVVEDHPEFDVGGFVVFVVIVGNDVNVYLGVVEHFAHLRYLPPHVVQIASSFGAVGQGEAVLGLVLYEKRWRFQFGVAEAEVLVKIVQAVEKVSQISAEDFENSIVAKLSNESDEIHTNFEHDVIDLIPSDL